MTAIDDIAAERRRQILEEGWTPEHDDDHARGELAFAAAVYAINSAEPHDQIELQVEHRGFKLRVGWAAVSTLLWPWHRNWWKPSNRRRDLVKAGALIVAEIERLDRIVRGETRGGKT
jgi:hypothetical protein